MSNIRNAKKYREYKKQKLLNEKFSEYSHCLNIESEIDCVNKKYKCSNID